MEVSAQEPHDHSESREAPLCLEACEVHCSAQEASQRLIVVEGNVKVQQRSLTLSSAVVLLLISAHILFRFYDKPDLTFPPFVTEMIWLVILMPWCGATGAKMIERFKGK